jgi:hypothetical protein
MKTLKLVKDYDSLLDTTPSGVPGSAVVLSADIEDILELPHHHLQRDENQRIKKMTPIFRKRVPTLYNFAVINVTEQFDIDLGNDVVTVTPGMRICDGHTRRLFFKENPQEKPTHPVLVTVYSVDNAQDYTAIYNAYDSADSVETTAHKITGAFRTLGILDRITAPVVKKGSIGTAISLAYPGDSRDPIIEKVAYFKDEILLLDALNVFSPNDNDLKFQTLWSSCLMFAKLYNGDKETTAYLRMINFLQRVAQIRSDDLSYSDNKWDGLTALLFEVFNPGKKGWIPEGRLRKTSFATVSPQMNFFLYTMIELYMADKKLDKTKGFKPSFWNNYTASVDDSTIGYYANVKESLKDICPV